MPSPSSRAPLYNICTANDSPSVHCSMQMSNLNCTKQRVLAGSRVLTRSRVDAARASAADDDSADNWTQALIPLALLKNPCVTAALLLLLCCCHRCCCVRTQTALASPDAGMQVACWLLAAAADGLATARCTHAALQLPSVVSRRRASSMCVYARAHRPHA